MAIFSLIFGAIAYMIATHPIIFFLLVVPIAIISLIGFIGWLKKG